jgi:hypothetical protein
MNGGGMKNVILKEGIELPLTRPTRQASYRRPAGRATVGGDGRQPKQWLISPADARAHAPA